VAQAGGKLAKAKVKWELGYGSWTIDKKFRLLLRSGVRYQMAEDEMEA